MPPRRLPYVYRTLLTATLVGATGLPVLAAGSGSGGQDPSLEQLLERLRRERDELQAPIRSEVEGIVHQLEQIEPDERDAIAHTQRARLEALGREAAPLLLPWIEPGAGLETTLEAPTPVPDEEQVFRARQVALALRELPTPATTDGLLHLAREGTPAGRTNAVVALAGCPERERVQPVLRAIYQAETGELRLRALEALARFPGSADLFIEALDDDELVDVALGALVQADEPEAVRHVIAVLTSPRGSRHLTAILEYFRAAPSALDDEALEALTEVLVGTQLSSDAKIEVLDTLSRLDIDLDSSIKKQLEPLTRSSSSQVSESALILLARQRDSKARRRLLEPYDDTVNRSKNRPRVYEKRADIYYRIGDLRAAVKDFKRALELGRNKGIDEAPFLGLARCYALQGKFKEAAEYLDRAPISVATLHELAQDPDFAEMVQDRRGREAFRLPEPEGDER